MNWGKLHLIGRDPADDGFKALVDRKIRDQRRDERRLAEQRATKHSVQARKSCVADARSYRIARRLPVPAEEPFDWKTLIPLNQLNQPLNKLLSAWIKKIREQQFNRWLSAK